MDSVTRNKANRERAANTAGRRADRNPQPQTPTEPGWRGLPVRKLANTTHGGIKFSIHACSVFAEAGYDTLGKLSDWLAGSPAGDDVPRLPSGDWYTLPIALAGVGAVTLGLGDLCRRLGDEARARENEACRRTQERIDRAAAEPVRTRLNAAHTPVGADPDAGHRSRLEAAEREYLAALDALDHAQAVVKRAAAAVRAASKVVSERAAVCRNLRNPEPMPLLEGADTRTM